MMLNNFKLVRRVGPMGVTRLFRAVGGPVGSRPFWRYVSERERARVLKESGAPWPWTKDPIIKEYHFINVRRWDNPEGKFVEREIVGRSRPRAEILFNLIVYRLFHRASTVSEIGWLDPRVSAADRIVMAAERIKASGRPVFGRGVTPCHLGVAVTGDKVKNYVLGIEHIRRHHLRRLVSELWEVTTAREAADAMMTCPGFGRFTANYAVLDLSRSVVPVKYSSETVGLIGDGARLGLGFIYGMEPMERQVERVRGLSLGSEAAAGFRCAFDDIESSLCEFSKYMRVKTGFGSVRRYVPGGGGE